MLTVVKVGGGLAREAGDGALRALCAQLAEVAARHALLLVPGGGEFADAVREHDRRFALRPETAHRMAILAMDQFGWALADLIPGAARVLDLGPVPDGVVSVLMPAAVLAERLRSAGYPNTWALAGGFDEWKRLQGALSPLSATTPDAPTQAAAH